MRKKRVIISVSNNLKTDQRVNKVASTLHNNGFEVLLVGLKSKSHHTAKPSLATKRLPSFFKKGFLFYAELNTRLFFFLLFSRCDILLANDTDTIIPNFLVSKIRRKKLVVDLHELYPEVPEVTDRKFVKNVWTGIESSIFPYIKTGYTVCQSIADYYKEKYGMTLKVVRNVPAQKPFVEKSDLLKYGDKKIILYQGAVNEGRGIEWVIDAMPYLDNAMFVVIGKGDLYEEMQEKVRKMQLGDRVIFKGVIPFQELAAYTNSADLGVCLLKQKGLSYYYSLPNRVFDFMQAHVPLLATDFPEIANVLNTYGTGRLISRYEPEYLAGVIREMLDRPVDHVLYEKANMEFNWEKEEHALLENFKT
jgi:glycosyltransferase involved in cell wall biosynthesis